jgi:hypothetical protein
MQVGERKKALLMGAQPRCGAGSALFSAARSSLFDKNIFRSVFSLAGLDVDVVEKDIEQEAGRRHMWAQLRFSRPR